MFAHQVIRDIDEWVLLKDQVFKDKLKLQINKAVKFHFGNHIDQSNMFKKNEGIELFQTDINYLKFPYELCWFDYDGKYLRRGYLINYYKKEDQPIAVIYHFCYYKDDKIWGIEPLYEMIEIGKKHTKSEEYVSFFDIWPYIKNEYDEHKKMNLFEELLIGLSLVEGSVRLINCKNIQTEIIKAPEALNKKRRKNGKQSIFDYHVLNVVVPSKKRGYSPATEPLSHNRVHLCRGHFKEYTSEHPLFGHLTGLYWWQPHVRGQNKSGIVVKNYNIIAK